MFNMQRRSRWFGATLATLFACSSQAAPQAPYPERPITLVAGWAAGGSADNVARLTAAEMSKVLGQTVIVHNQPGAGGNIASNAVMRAAPDGYTMMLATSASHGFNIELFSNLGYEPMIDFTPIGMINTSPSTLLVPAASDYRTVQDVIDAARARPGQLNFGSAGVGSSQHLYGSMFEKRAGVDITHVPYNGVAPALTDLMAGRLDMILSTGVVPFVRSGKLRAIAVASPQRLPALPDVPTFDESGLPGFYTSSWYGLAAPKGTPAAARETLNAALIKALSSPDVRRLFTEQGAFTAEPLSPAQFWDFVKTEMAASIELVRASGAKID